MDVIIDISTAQVSLLHRTVTVITKWLFDLVCGNGQRTSFVMSPSESSGRKSVADVDGGNFYTSRLSVAYVRLYCTKLSTYLSSSTYVLKFLTFDAYLDDQQR